MKVGDSIPVQIDGHTVAQAQVKSIEGGEATIIIPGTVVRASVVTQLDLGSPAPSSDPASEVILTDEVLKPEPQAPQPAPDLATTQNPGGTEPVENSTVETPPGTMGEDVTQSVEAGVENEQTKEV